MKVTNEAKGNVIAEAELIVSSFHKALGLMFKRTPKPFLFLFRIPRRVRLHMFFVFFPIDVVYIGKDRKVVEIKEGLQPWRTYKPSKKCRFVLELPDGTVSEKGVEVGDRIAFSEEKYLNQPSKK